MKRVLATIFTICFCGICFYTNCYAATKVTKENLKESFEKFIKSNESGDNFKTSEDTQVIVDDNKIKLITDGEERIIKYDLTNKPTFTYEVKVKNGMSYDEFNTEYNLLTSNLLGYIAVANIQGVDVQDAIVYVLGSYLKKNISNASTSEYIIVEDNNDFKLVVSDKKVITKSEFSENVINYLNSILKDERTNFDDKDEYNTYQWTIEKKDVTDESCTLVSTIEVNLDGDFSKIKGSFKKFGNAVKNTINSANETDNNTSGSNSESKNYIEDSSKLPQTGREFGLVDALYILIGISIVSMLAIIVMWHKYRKAQI